jgi:hypothetical protein
MQSKNHVNMAQNHVNTHDRWYRCGRVEFSGKRVTWELASTAGYSYRDDYEKAPHCQLIRAGDDEALRAFVKAWGPLRRSLKDWSGTDAIDTYRKVRDRLDTTARLIACVAETPEHQRDALRRFVILAQYDEVAEMLWDNVPLQLSTYRNAVRAVEKDALAGVSDWSARDVEQAVQWLVSVLEPPVTTERFQVITRKPKSVRVAPGINNLVDALDWMLWQDVREGHPVQFCQECRELIWRLKPTKHARKYCTEACAHKSAGREFQRRKRKKEREKNGPEKTR